MLSTLTPRNSQCSDPGPRTCSANSCEITYQTLVNEGLLTAGFTGVEMQKSSCKISLKRTRTTPNYGINGLVVTRCLGPKEAVFVMTCWAEPCKQRVSIAVWRNLILLHLAPWVNGRKTRSTTPGLTRWGCWPTVLDMTVSLYRYCACDDREKGLTALFMKFSQSHFVTLLYCKWKMFY